MKYAVYAQYEYTKDRMVNARVEKGTIISVHKNAELAEKAAKGNSFAAIDTVRDSARKGQNIYDKREED